MKKNTTIENKNNGPTKLWMFLPTMVIHENTDAPSTGNSTYLPNRMMMPVTASTTKEIAMVQCAMRSTLLKRSIRRPLGLSCSLNGPLMAKNSSNNTGTTNKAIPP